jgi:hypothetical protein
MTKLFAVSNPQKSISTSIFISQLLNVMLQKKCHGTLQLMASVVNVNRLHQ